MRNLKLKRRVCSVGVQAPGSPHCLSVRMDSGSLLIASALSIIEYDPRTAQVLDEVSLTAEDYLAADGSGTVVGIQDLPDQECVCVATANGDVILYNLNTHQLECVGSVDTGLTGMSWSPDQELVTLTTGQQTIIVMTKDFEPITEVQIHQEDFGEGKFITVGWGKKETQFHGSAGKQAAQKKNTEVLPAVEWDDRRPRVTWRGDGQLFAVSAVCPQTGARKVRVWNRECVLQATSETINGLEQALCWKPSGSLIASTQRHPNKHSVVFLEKNGLLHGDFTLPLQKDQAKVKELLWNSDSTVLAVWLEDMNPGEDGLINTQIQLWSVGNYHWYLKQCLRWGSGQEAPMCVVWDPERPLQLYLLTHAWTCVTYQWGWTTDRSYGDAGHDNANVAVIDGDKVLVTAFRQCVVPPPMSSFELQLPAPVTMVTFCCEAGHSNDLAAMTEDGRLCVYGQGDGGSSASGSGGFRIITHPPVLKNTYRVELGGAGPLALRLVVWLREDNFLAVTCGEVIDQSKVLLLKPSANDGTLQISSQECVEGHVISVCHSGRSNAVALQLEDGQIRKLLWEDRELVAVPWEDSTGNTVNFPQPCEHTALCTISGEELPLGLTDRSHLYLGDTELASGVSSFVVCDDFLLLTTHAHTCRCLQLSTNTIRGLVSVLSSDGGQNDETLRRVERGSRIVTMVPHDTRLILQMPRGNLETIHHRALVLAQLRKWLDSLRFRDAFEVMRKQRINLNLIYDHNPKVFLENVEMFLNQVDSINHINLFLTELRDEDTTKTMYPCPSTCTPPSAPGVTGKKVDIVCDALRATMECLNPDRYCLCILTTHVKKTVPELETALQKVHQLRVNTPSSSEAVKAEEALKYLLFLVDVNDLYTHSLGTYDFTLVLMVAEKSQKDPKEYLPFLNMLKTLELNYQRYTIDKHLKRYSKALQHLSKCGDEYFSEVLNLVKDQQLYREALSLYPTDSSQYKELSAAYAEHLVERSQAEMAGLLLWRCGELARALQAFVGGASWRHALSVAMQMPLPPDQLALLARDLADKLLEQRRYTEASVLLEQYAKDCEEAISALITGAAWEEALRLVHLYNRQDIIETNLKPALLEAYTTQVSFLESQKALFSRHQTRLAVVREEKEKARQEMLDEGDCGDVELYSEASSVMSGSHVGSRYTHSNSRISARSSKNRRKAEGKKFSLKEGSPFEETALLHALTHITHTVDKMREEIQGLLKALVLFQYDDQAGTLQRNYSQLLTLMESNIPLIWIPNNTQTLVTGPTSTANSITASFQQQRVPPTAQQDTEAFTPPKMRTSVKWKLCVLD
ncbi:elongator complex protein 1 [Alosa sapidissima]|uniref:elongator complex protein 1 n=1 Tax=Alosa sapidissima TaxID=34773 RepID=UPI001C099F70|nr:elongator complex protein 1 [Alosa sapidissima]XP_041916666.1 elongator complex protein 1 [Alosa sapidissima]XP_041916667.1 elongator complex protein 1 [Alosa sapidissima]XP_041916668.1 elongator complex protein 1 [Alosa sapidissima]